MAPSKAKAHDPRSAETAGKRSKSSFDPELLLGSHKVEKVSKAKQRHQPKGNFKHNSGSKTLASSRRAKLLDLELDSLVSRVKAMDLSPLQEIRRRVDQDEAAYRADFQGEHPTEDMVVSITRFMVVREALGSEWVTSLQNWRHVLVGDMTKEELEQYVMCISGSLKPDELLKGWNDRINGVGDRHSLVRVAVFTWVAEDSRAHEDEIKAMAMAKAKEEDEDEEWEDVL